MAWLYVPDLPELNWDFDSPSEIPIELWVTSNGKPIARPPSWRGWRTRPWIEPLYGTTCRPLTADYGAVEWISSLEDTPVSRSASLEDVSAHLIHAISGHTFDESSGKVDHLGVFLRTSPGTYLWALRRSTMTLKRWGTELRQACSERKRSALPTDERDYSSWPTPSMTDNTGRGYHRSGGRPYLALPGAARLAAGDPSGLPEDVQKLWGTPTARDWKDGVDPSSNVPTKGLLGRQAPRQTGQTGVALNPQFVEMLMGLPIGWSDCVPLEMESYQRWLLAHSRNWC